MGKPGFIVRSSSLLFRLMRVEIVPKAIPLDSEISHYLKGADFIDSYEAPVGAALDTPLEIYLGMVVKTPAWVNGLMALRNRLVSGLGLKDLGHLGSVIPGKPASAYAVGDRVGIFTIHHLSESEVILGDSDKHLDVRVSVFKVSGVESRKVAVSTVVHVHNTLGRAYLLMVVPFHKIIVPAMLSKSV